MIPVEGWKPGRPKFKTLDEAVRDRPTERTWYPGEQKMHANAWYDRIINRKRFAYQIAYNTYTEDMGDGVAMEVARSELPVAIYSSCWVTCNPRSLMAFLSLRKHDENATFVSYPQAEIQEAAVQCEALFAQHWPITQSAFHKNGRVGP